MKVLRKIILVVVVALFFAGTILIEALSGQDLVNLSSSGVMIVSSKGEVELLRNGVTSKVAQQEILPGDELKVPNAENCLVRLPEGGVLRIAPGSIFKYRLADSGSPNYVFEIVTGHLWVNTLYSQADLEVIAGSSVLIPAKSVFDVTVDHEKALAMSIQNHTLVKIMANDSFITDFLLVQGSQAKIYFDKIKTSAVELKKLLYSKLIKEFQYSLYDLSETSKDFWYVMNMKLDHEYTASRAQEVLQATTAKGLKNADINSVGYEFMKFVRTASNALTFSADRVVSRNLDFTMEQFSDTEYLLTYGRISEAKERIELIKQLVSSNVSDPKYKDLLIERLEKLYATLGFVMPGDPFFDLKKAISEILLTYLKDDDLGLNKKMVLIREYSNYAYALAETNLLNARISLDTYTSKMLALFKSNRPFFTAKSILVVRENQVFDNLLRQFPQFYQENYFAGKSAFEAQWLATITDSGIMQEDRQTIISTKIDFLKQIQGFYLEGKVAQADAKKIVARLITEIMDDKQYGSVLGVSQLFELRLKDYGKFLRFLSSVDSSSLSGMNIKESYSKFLAAASTAETVDQVINEFLGQKTVAPQITVDKIIEQINNDFNALEVTNLQLASITSVDQLSVQIYGGIISGVQFSCTYNWDKKLISDLKTKNTLVATGPVRLDSLKSLLLKTTVPRVVTQQTSETGTQVVTTDSRAEVVAKILLVKKLKNLNIAVSDKAIKVLNLSAGLFSILNSGFVDNPSAGVEIRFTFNNKTNLASDISVTITDKVKTISGSIDIAELSKSVKELLAN